MSFRPEEVSAVLAQELERYEAKLETKIGTSLDPFSLFALGAATALMGEKAAMACTAAVEEVIEEHYARQGDALSASEPLAATIAEFCEDEAAHRFGMPGTFLDRAISRT